MHSHSVCIPAARSANPPAQVRASCRAPFPTRSCGALRRPHCCACRQAAVQTAGLLGSAAAATAVAAAAASGAAAFVRLHTSAPNPGADRRGACGGWIRLAGCAAIGQVSCHEKLLPFTHCLCWMCGSLPADQALHG